jgi:polysaccharide pyruvyl transferase CsaB
MILEAPRPSVGICGSYGGLNVGDEAILTVALEQLRDALPDVELTVFSRDAAHTRAHHDVDRVVDARATLRNELCDEVGRLGLLLLGGGGILYDREAERYLHLPRIAQSLGVRTATYAIGAGPLERPHERRSVADVLNGMAAITVRDVRTRRLLEETGVERDIVVTADPALLLDCDATDRGAALLPRGRRHQVGMSVREPGGAVDEGAQDGYHQLLAHAADFVASRYDAELVFVPMEHGDIRHAHRVIGEMAMPDRALVLHEVRAPREVLALMRQFDMAIGMRLHFLLFAALAGVPFMALPYASKVTSFVEAVGMPAPKLVERQHAGALMAAIDRTWDLRDEWAAGVSARLRPYQEEARRTPELIKQLLPTCASTTPTS